MRENQLRENLISLRNDGKIDEGIKLLIENTGKDKVIDPSDTLKMEGYWSEFANPLLLKGQLDNFVKVCQRMYDHLLKLQRQSDSRIHKGWSLYSAGNGFLQKAGLMILLSFIEDTISHGSFPKDALSTATLHGVFRVDSDFLRELSRRVIKEPPNKKDPSRVLTDLGVKMMPAELWKLEYQMERFETRLREFIEKQLSKKSPEWWQTLIPENVRNKVEDRIEGSAKVLWFSEQSASPLTYLSFPTDYIDILKCEDCWVCLEPAFEHTFDHKALLTGRLEGLGHIRHKIAHYRKISKVEKSMFETTIQTLDKCIEKAIKTPKAHEAPISTATTETKSKRAPVTEPPPQWTNSESDSKEDE